MCQRHKECAAFTEDATPADLNDAYNTCMEECAAWPVEMVKCINAIDINVPNDCVGFLNCQLPQYYEEKYLKTYVDAPDSVMVLVQDGERVVGASSGLPLKAETPNVIKPFLAHGYDPRRIFYYGESVLLPEYRGRGLGKRFFAEREVHVRGLGGFEIACFCAVQRSTDHPRRPAGYMPLDVLWNRQGFIRHPELHTTFSWRDLDEDQESPKPMVFWLKQLT